MNATVNIIQVYNYVVQMAVYNTYVFNKYLLHSVLLGSEVVVYSVIRYNIQTAGVGGTFIPDNRDNMCLEALVIGLEYL